MGLTLFVGNGVNLVDKTSVSWGELLSNLIRMETKDISDELGMTLRFEFIEAVSSKKCIEIKRAIAKEVHENSMRIIGKHSSVHGQLMKLPIDTIITTNYDYSLEFAADKDFSPDRTTSEQLYSFYRKQVVSGTTVFHIHGECRYPNTICLGFEQYAGILEKMRHQLVLSTKEDNTDNRFHLYDVLRGLVEADEAWYYHLFLNDVVFLGFGFDPSEEDIWWLLTYRRKLKEQYPDLICNRLILLDTEPKRKQSTPAEKAKRKVLEAMDIKIEPLIGRTYVEKYKSALRRLNELINKEAYHV